MTMALISGQMNRYRIHIPIAAAALLGILLAAIPFSGGCRRGPRLAAIVRGGKGPPTLVLLHGYGSSAEKWEPFTQTIALPPKGRFIFPQGPEVTVPPDGPVGGRAWWRLDLESHIPAGQSVPDLSATHPEGLVKAASLVEDLLNGLKGAEKKDVILGGFSQGAMVAGEVAFASDQQIAALVMLSGTIVDESTWKRQFPRRRGLRVFLSHGRQDTMLPFAVAERLHSELVAAGLDVTWCPFNGGHEIPEEAVIALNKFIEQLPAPR
jgi:phospholipase/carboxylesterase